MAETEWHQWQSPTRRHFERRPYPQSYEAGSIPRPPSQEETLKDEFVWIERKSFTVTLKENPRGRFLRITEGSSGRRNSIIIPSTGLKEFQRVLEEMIKASNEVPPKAEPDTAPKE